MIVAEIYAFRIGLTVAVCYNCLQGKFISVGNGYNCLQNCYKGPQQL